MQPPPHIVNLPAGGQGINTTFDTTNLEHSFDELGRMMVNLLQEQRTTEKLEEQFQLANDTSILQTQALQEGNESLRVFILKYVELHKSAVGKKPTDETNPFHLMKFLRKMNNKAISHKVTQKGIPDGTTLLEIFNKVIELEAGFQLSEALSLNSLTEIMETVVKSMVVNEVTTPKKKSKRIYV